MNGCGSWPTKMGRDRQVAVPKYLKSRTVNEGIPDERNGGIHGGGRRDLADLLPADEPGAKPQDAARERRQRRFQHRPQRQFQWRRLEPVSWSGSDDLSSDSSTSS